jgi:hypothetical protein
VNESEGLDIKKLLDAVAGMIIFVDIIAGIYL